MNGFASLSQVLDGKGLGIRCAFCSLHPGVAIRMKRNTTDTNGCQSFDEKFGAMPFMDSRQRRKQFTGARQFSQDFGHLFAEGNKRGDPRFVSLVSNSLV